MPYMTNPGDTVNYFQFHLAICQLLKIYQYLVVLQLLHFNISYVICHEFAHDVTCFWAASLHLIFKWSPLPCEILGMPEISSKAMIFIFLIPFWLIIMWDCAAPNMHLTQAMYVICTCDWQQNLTYVWYVAPSTQKSTLTCFYAPPTIYWLKGKRGLTSVYK